MADARMTLTEAKLLMAVVLAEREAIRLSRLLHAEKRRTEFIRQQLRETEADLVKKTESLADEQDANGQFRRQAAAARCALAEVAHFVTSWKPPK